MFFNHLFDYGRWKCEFVVYYNCSTNSKMSIEERFTHDIEKGEDDHLDVVMGQAKILTDRMGILGSCYALWK